MVSEVMKTLFHEVYSAYFSAVSEILARAVDGTLTPDMMKRICDEKAFSESFLKIIPALTEEKWQLLCSDMSTPLTKEPSQPLTALQKRWLKAISLDPRMKLFDLDWSFLDGVQPLFMPDDILYFDKYADGDPFNDPHYIEVFRTALFGIKTGSVAEIIYHSAKGRTRRIKCRLQLLEYSEKDDKFRLRVSGCRNVDMLRVAGIESMLLCPGLYFEPKPPEPQRMCCMEAELIDERNALERAMLHFSHFERETSHIGGNRYRLRVFYSENDETELLIRVLSFGPMMRVYAPKSLVDEIRRRLRMQYEMGIR